MDFCCTHMRHFISRVYFPRCLISQHSSNLKCRYITTMYAHELQPTRTPTTAHEDPANQPIPRQTSPVQRGHPRKAIDAPSFHTPDMHLSELATSTNSDSDTPALREVTSSEDDTPFNDVRALPKYGVDTPLDG